MSSLYIHIPFCVSKCDYCDFFSVPCSWERISDVESQGGAERISDVVSRSEVERISDAESRGDYEGRISSIVSRAENIIPDEYVFALCNEIKFRTRQFDVKKWETVYIGGGTPSLLSEKQIKMISDEIFSLSKDIKEFTIEVNPCDVTKEALLCYEKCGITRLSLGVQSLNDEVLNFSKRRSSLFDVKNALDAIKNDWKHDFSCDIISSLPHQTKKSFLSELKTLVSYEPNHISLYSLTIESETPLGKAVESGKLHYNFDKASEVWLKGRDFLLKNGYEQYEVSNFFNKKNGSPCLHNLNYWQLKNYIGCGSGAVGSIYDKHIRYENTKNIAEYVKFWSKNCGRISKVASRANAERIAGIESRAETERIAGIESRSCVENVEHLDKKTEMFEYFMMNLRIFNGFGITDDDFFKRFALHIPENVIKLFEKWQKSGEANIWTENGQKHYSLNEKGILFLNRFLTNILP